MLGDSASNPIMKLKYSLTTINLIYFPLLLCVPAGSEIITLQKGQNISYVATYDSTNLPVFLNPPVKENIKKKNIALNNIDSWTNDDWSNKSANNSIQGAVTDKRWTDFECMQRNLVVFNQKTVSFSAYTSTNMDLFLRDSTRSWRVPIDKKNITQWEHFNILSKNNKVYIIENNRIIREINECVPTQIIAKSNDAFWKIHDYTFRWSDKITEGESTALKIPPSGKSCLMLYVSLGKHSFLEIDLKSNSKNEKEIITSTDEHLTLTKLWQTYTIEIEPNEEKELLFSRKTNKSGSAGYWALDIELGNCEMEIHTVTLPEGNFTQHVFQLLNDNSKIHEGNFAFSCPLGYIGQHCNITCEAVLGELYPHCEKHLICQNSVCLCAWGYTGSSCNKTCVNGTWGLSCQKKCDPNCRTCSGLTGKCLSISTTGQISLLDISKAAKSILIAMFILVPVIAILIYISKYRDSQIRRVRNLLTQV